MNTFFNSVAKSVIPKSYLPWTQTPYRYTGSPYSMTCGVEDGFKYVEYNGERIFFPNDFTIDQSETYLRGCVEDEGLCGEGRRKKSPHCYVDASHRPHESDVFVDIGAAEGYVARHYASLCKKLYLFECDEKWFAPLQKTFKDYMHKVTIVEKFIGARTRDGEIRLEDAIDDPVDESYFVKMDIEGGEVAVIESSRDFLMNRRVQISCCTYHRRSDARIIRKLLQGYGFETRFSDGWMFPYAGKWFRRGVIYGKNY